MSKTDAILLGAIVGVLLITVLVLLVRNRQLARGQRIWMHAALANHAAAVAPMPPAAETVKLSNFQRVLDQRDKSADENRELMRQLRDARLELREADEAIRLFSEENKKLERMLGEEKAKSLHLGGLYKEADLERQRLRLENGRLREERRTTVN